MNDLPLRVKSTQPMAVRLLTEPGKRRIGHPRADSFSRLRQDRLRRQLKSTDNQRHKLDSL
jgi:hypothetical protein